MKNKFAFDKTKKEILYRDNWHCSLCGGNQELQAHHILHKRGNAKSIFNSLWICRECHSKYGSSSADESDEHLEKSAKVILLKLESLVKNDLNFNLKSFLTDEDKDFINENYHSYTIDTWDKLEKLWK